MGHNLKTYAASVSSRSIKLFFSAYLCSSFTFIIIFLTSVITNSHQSEVTVRKMSGGINVKVDKFTGRNSFSLWQIKMRALLKQQGLWAPLNKKSKDSESAEMASLEEKAHSTILLCLADDIITEIAKEDTASGLWLKLESLYMTDKCIFLYILNA